MAMNGIICKCSLCLGNLQVFWCGRGSKSKKKNVGWGGGMIAVYPCKSSFLKRRRADVPWSGSSIKISTARAFAFFLQTPL